MKAVDMSALHTSDFSEVYFCVGRREGRIPNTETVCLHGERLYCRLFYVLRGEFFITQTDKEEIKAVRGDILYLPYDVSYVSRWQGDDCAYCSINFVLNNTEGAPILFCDEVCIIKHDKSENYLFLFEEIANIWDSGVIGYKMRARARFFDLLYHMLKDNIKTRYKNIAEGIMYLENHYLENTTVDELAAMCHVSPSGFRHLFKEYSPHPPVQYRNILRVQKAEELLRSGEYTVNSAAEAVGIPDVYYFSKLFKKITGKNPKSFKK